MITTSMTASELFEEIKDDYPNVFAISDTKDAKASRIINKSGIFPVRIHSFVTTTPVFFLTRACFIGLFVAKPSSFAPRHQILSRPLC